MKEQRALLHPYADFWMAGGLGLLFLPLAYFFPRGDALTLQLIASSFFLQFAINFPHFGFSYQLLYSQLGSVVHDKSQSRWTRLKWLNASVIVPVAIIGGMIALMELYSAEKMIGIMINAMLFFVGWHYVKQAYGVLVSLSAVRGYYLSKRQKWLLLSNSYLVWICAWVMANYYYEGGTKMFGIAYETAPITMNMVGVMCSFTMLSTALLASGMIRHWRNLPPLSAMAGYFSGVYLWILCVIFLHPLYVAFVPALHSLQYILFVLALQRNKARRENKPRAVWKHPLLLFTLAGAVIGAAGFYFIPNWLDANTPVTLAPGTNGFWFICFTLFINIHHYFIDNVLWRRENRQLMQHMHAGWQRGAGGCLKLAAPL